MECVHLINPLASAVGGSEWRTLSLYEHLGKRCEVRLWTEYAADPALLARYPIEQITEGHAPQGGTLVVIGVNYAIGEWIRGASPRRTILCYNSFSLPKLNQVHGMLEAATGNQVEVVYASAALREGSTLDGIVEDSIIDVAAFRPRTPRRRTESGAFHVGRLSRNLPQKHHASDVALYERLGREGCTVTVMGGTCLAEQASHLPHLKLLPAGALPAPDFLRSLDCFFYRIAATSFEASGRVVTEAMASELPVVCHRRGGYRDYIVDGRTGFLFDTDDEAFDRILMLKHDADLRASIGKAARESMEERFSPSRVEAILEKYLR